MNNSPILPRRPLFRGLSCALGLCLAAVSARSQTDQSDGSITPDPWTPEIPTDGAWLGAYCFIPTTDTSDGGTTDTGNWTTGIQNHEALIGRDLDVVKRYEFLSTDYEALDYQQLAFIAAGKKVFIDIKPPLSDPETDTWADAAAGSDDSYFASFAASIAAIKPARIMISIWHEADSDLGGHASPGTDGSAADYRAMWQHVEQVFTDNKATNVIWAWQMVNSPLTEDTDMNAVYPGDGYVNWVMWDPYQETDTDNLYLRISDGYTWLMNNSTTGTDGHNYASKPFGLAEWGAGYSLDGYRPTPAEEEATFTAIDNAVNDGDWPNLYYLSYWDNLDAEISDEAYPTYADFANSSYMFRPGGVYDDFTDGVQWTTTDTGTWTATANPCSLSGTDTAGLAFVQAGSPNWGEYTASATIEPTSFNNGGGSVGLAVHVSDNILSRYTAFLTTDGLTIEKEVEGNKDSTFGSVPYSFDLYSDYTVAFEVLGRTAPLTLSVSIDGTQVWTTDDGTDGDGTTWATDGGIGLAVYNGSATFTNVTVK